MQSQVDVIVAGHLCLDIIPKMDNLSGDPATLWKPGTLHHVGAAVLATGGAVSNTGISLHQLGMKTRLLGKVGDDAMGVMVKGLLNGVSPVLGESVIVSPGEATSYSLVLSPGNCDRLFLHSPGANDTYTSDDVPADMLTGARLMHFGYPPNMRQFYEDGGAQLEKLFAKAKSQGLTTSLDMVQMDPNSDAARLDWPALLKRVLPLVDLFLPSLDEICFMLGHDASQPNIALLDIVADELLVMGATIVGLKLGDMGMYLRTTGDLNKLQSAGAAAPGRDWLNRQLLAPCFQVTVVGTTGSGDSTIAGFLAGLLNHLSPEESLNIAVGVGAHCVERPDATSGIPTWPALQSRLGKPWPRKPVRLSMPGWVERASLWFGPDDQKDQR